MSQPNIVLFCENNHFDALTHAAEVAVINRLDKQKWIHSLVESDQFITGDITPKEGIDLYVDTLSRQSTNNICFSDMTITRLKFNNTFISHDFDVENEERDELLNEIDLCPKLDSLQRSIVDSEFFGFWGEQFFKDQPSNIKRKQKIVENLENLSNQLGDNFTIGWVGQGHCVDYHHHLVETNSPLLDKILFLNINTPCTGENFINENDVSDMLSAYYFYYCQEDLRFIDVVNRILPYKKLFTQSNSPQEKIQSMWAQDFIESPHVLNLNVSIFGESGTILPWQVAELDIFN